MLFLLLVSVSIYNELQISRSSNEHFQLRAEVIKPTVKASKTHLINAATLSLQYNLLTVKLQEAQL